MNISVDNYLSMKRNHVLDMKEIYPDVNPWDLPGDGTTLKQPLRKMVPASCGESWINGFTDMWILWKILCKPTSGYFVHSCHVSLKKTVKNTS